MQIACLSIRGSTQIPCRAEVLKHAFDIVFAFDEAEPNHALDRVSQ